MNLTSRPWRVIATTLVTAVAVATLGPPAAQADDSDVEFQSGSTADFQPADDSDVEFQSGLTAGVQPMDDSNVEFQSSVGGTITRHEILERAEYWVKKGVPYSMSKYYPGPGGRDYRTDCSGFVALAFHLSSSPSTVSLPQHVNRIQWSDLKPGDVVGTLGSGTGGANGHVVVFTGWANKEHTRFYTMEQRGGVGATRYERPINFEVGSHHAKPYRYKNVTDARWPRLSEDKRGKNVRSLKLLMSDQGYSGFTINNGFGPGTTKAVNKFKAKNGLARDGVVGPGVWKNLLPRLAIKRSDGTRQRGQDVLALKHQLHKHGYNVDTTNDWFTDSLGKKVKDFKSDRGLRSDRTVDVKTWKYLLGEN